MTVDKQPDRTTGPMHCSSAACHETGEHAGIHPREEHTAGGFVGSVGACNLRRVPHMETWAWVCGFVGLEGEAGPADWCVCAAPHSELDSLLVAFVGKHRFAGCIWIAENEAAHRSEFASAASPGVALGDGADPDDLVAHSSAVPDCFAPFGPGSISCLRLVHAAEKLHDLVGSNSGRGLDLIGSSRHGQDLGLMVVCWLLWPDRLRSGLMKHSAESHSPSLAAVAPKPGGRDGVCLCLTWLLHDAALTNQRRFMNDDGNVRC